MFARYIARLAVALVIAVLPATALAAPSGPESPKATLSATTARPGQTVGVIVTGLTASNHVNATLCVGMLGPGRNVELGRSPAFRPKVGQIAIGANGAGQTNVQVPTDFVPGSYQVIVGGCAPRPFLAPLATLASATLTVVTATPTPARLPSTGGAPRTALFGLLVVGLVSLSGGVLARRGRRGSSGTRDKSP